jgi:hypothetical protein
MILRGHVYELRNRKDTSKLLIWCGFGSEVRMDELAVAMMRPSEPPHRNLFPAVSGKKG